MLLPELCLTGYTCGDVFYSDDLHRAALEGLKSVAVATASHGSVVVVGLPMVIGSRLYNVAALCAGGTVVGIVPKTYLPNGHEYYDQRWFASAFDLDVDIVEFDGRSVPVGTDLLFVDTVDRSVVYGIEVCEDLWSVQPPSGGLAIAGATVILNPSASNDIVGKATYRRSLVQQQSARTYTAYAYASAGPWESTTDTVFSGHCMIAEAGDMVAEGDRLSLDDVRIVADIDVRRLTAERMASTSFRQERGGRPYRRLDVPRVVVDRSDVRRPVVPTPFVPRLPAERDGRCAELLRIQATALAVRWQRTGARRLVLGLSGGLDSTLAVLVCVEACRLLARPFDDVVAITMPGLGTTVRTRTNAVALAAALGITLRTIDITEATLQHFADIGHDPDRHDVVYENAQARERTQVLMDVANAVGGFVVGTGDLSELALGWCTYNADHMSMYGVNAGVPKTLVRTLVEWYARGAAADVAAILRDVADTPISPELLPPDRDGTIRQVTEDTVGPYVLHDFFLFHFLRYRTSVRRTVALALVAFDGVYDAATICRWYDVFLTRFFQQQFKRSCLPDGVKVGRIALSPRADWRMPSDMSPAVWRTELSIVRRELDVTP